MKQKNILLVLMSIVVLSSFALAGCGEKEEKPETPAANAKVDKPADANAGQTVGVDVMNPKANRPK